MAKRVELGGSEQASSCNDFRKIILELMGTHNVRQEMPKEVVVICADQQVIWLEDMISKVFFMNNSLFASQFPAGRHKVKEEIKSALAEFSGGNQSNAVSKEKNLLLEFSDEVSLPVLTGKHIVGKGDTYIKVALVDKMSGEVVKSGPESSGEVEILLLDDDDHKWSPEDISNRVIKEGDKKRPHFAKHVCVHLSEGIGIIKDARLGQDSTWQKKFECRLVARMKNFNGVKVQEAWTEPFVVSDSRGERQRKGDIPSLSDSVCTLKNIGDAKGRHLNDKNIKTVKDFLFMLSINPQELQQIASVASAKWKATVDHAQACIIDDKSVQYYEFPEIDMAVAFNVVGVLKGIIQDSHFIPYDELSEEQKNSAHKLRLSTYETQKDIKSFEDEEALLRQFPHRARIELDEGLSQSYLCPGLDNHSGTCGDTSILNIPDEYNNIKSFEDEDALLYLRCIMLNEGLSPGYSFHGLDNPSETFGDISTLNFPHEDNNIMNNIDHNESYPHQQSNGGTIHFGRVMAVMLWTLRVRNRSELYLRKGKQSMASGGIHVQKRQRTD